MTEKWNRRDVLKRMAVAGTALALRGSGVAQLTSVSGDHRLDIQIVPVSEHTFRLSIFADHGSVTDDGSLLHEDWGKPTARLQGDVKAQTVRIGKVDVQISANPLSFTIVDSTGRKVQQLTVDAETGGVSFATGASPLLGLGEGGPQFDRRGSTDRMVSGQGGYRLHTHGGRVPIPWIIGTAGWAMFIHQPFGTFDFSGPQSKFHSQPRRKVAARYLLRHFQRSGDDHGRIRGPHRPRRDAAAVEFRLSAIASHPGQPRGDPLRGKNLPREETALRCADLPGHRFLPVGMERGKWIVCLELAGVSRSRKDDRPTAPGSLPRGAARRDSRGQVAGPGHDPCTLSRFDEEEAGCYWDTHRKDFAMGVDGWWPDEGDPHGHCVAPGAQPDVLGRAADRSARTSVPTRCIATATPACSATHRSCGRAMSSPPGRR